VAITDIETVVPGVGEQILVLRGAHKGCTGDVIEADVPSGGGDIVTVQLHDDMSVQAYGAEDICLYHGSGP